MVEPDLTEIESIVLRYNRVAMDYLKLDNYKDTFILLKKAENILNSDQVQSMPNRLKLVSITYNNLGCYYKKSKKPMVALNYLQKALDLEMESDSDSANMASSHLNICAILSSLQKHEEAFVHSQKAISLLEKAKNLRPNNSRISINLIISYYNTAVELEYLGRFSDSIVFYNKALFLAENDLGKHHPLIKTLENASQRLEKRLAKKIEKVSTKESINYMEIKNTRLPSLTPALKKHKTSRSIATPIRNLLGRISPYEKIKSSSFKSSL